MTKRMMGLMIVAVLLLGGVLSSARAEGNRRQHRDFAQRRIERMATHLNLTEDQKNQIKGIFEAQAPAMKERHQQLAALRRQIRELNSDGQYHEAEASKLFAQQAQVMADGMAAREKARLQVFNVLTPEQRQKAEETRKAFHHRFGGENKIQK